MDKAYMTEKASDKPRLTDGPTDRPTNRHSLKSVFPYISILRWFWLIFNVIQPGNLEHHILTNWPTNGLTDQQTDTTLDLKCFHAMVLILWQFRLIFYQNWPGKLSRYGPTNESTDLLYRFKASVLYMMSLSIQHEFQAFSWKPNTKMIKVNKNLICILWHNENNCNS